MINSNKTNCQIFFFFYMTVVTTNKCSTHSCAKPTRVQPAAEGEAAVLLVKGEGVHLQAAGHRHLHGPVVPHPAWGVHVDVRDRWRLARVDAGREHMWQGGTDMTRVWFTCLQTSPSCITRSGVLGVWNVCNLMCAWTEKLEDRHSATATVAAQNTTLPCDDTSLIKVAMCRIYLLGLICWCCA